ncbi:MAG: tRNA lysidine(34) synthetase TilS [Thermodesulfobacteriota bacterium]
MHPLEKKIAAFVAENELLPPGRPLLLAVSGGADSLALLYLLARLQDPLELGELNALYVDHGLRPLETEAERRLVAQSCEDLAVGFSHAQVDVAGRREESQGKSLEEAARELRYEALAQAAREHGAAIICVAHHGDDQAEELIIRLLRGSGRGGLSGMAPRRFDGVVRPLLCTSKGELVAYLERSGLSWCEDSSNSDLSLLRNQVRLEILPFLEGYNPALRQTLQGMARTLAKEEDLLAGLSRDAAAEIISGGDDELRLAITPLLALHPALQRRLVEEVFIRLAARPAVVKIEQVIRLARHGQGQAQLHFARGLRVYKVKGELIFTYPRGREAWRGSILPKG